MLVLFQLLGCGPSRLWLRQYAGPPRSEEQVARLRLRPPARQCRFLLLDRQKLPDCDCDWLHIEMLPGNHELAVIDPMIPQRPPRAVTFSVVAGHSYAVFFPLGLQGHRLAAVVRELEPSSERVLRKVSSPVDEDAGRGLR